MTISIEQKFDFMHQVSIRLQFSEKREQYTDIFLEAEDELS